MKTVAKKNTPILATEEKTQIDSLLEKLNAELKISSVKTADPALMYGKSGMLIFLCYYQRYKGTSENQDVINELLEQIFEDLQSDQNFGYHFAGGLTGVFWTLRHLANRNLIDPEIIDGLSETEDQFLAAFVDSENERKNYDLFYGTIGAGLLLLEREEVHTDLFSSIFDGLVAMKRDFFYGSGYEDPIPYIRQDKEEDFEGDKIKEIYNLGMAHGSPSIMVFTALIAKSNVIPKAKIEDLINRVDSFMSYHKMDKDQDSIYPIWFQPSDPDPFPSRLSWCYGDLSIACGYALIGKELDNTGFQRSATQIGQSTQDRQDMTKAKLFDSCLCHGSAGNMHMYRRLFDYTQDETFAELEKKWSAIGLDIFKQTKGDHAFTYYDSNKFKENNSFLEGLAGTGLAYLARVDKQNSPDWDRILLLS